MCIRDRRNRQDYTRDQLVVEGYLENEKIYFIVNHWPSRSGGELRSRPFRNKAAELNRRIIDSIQSISKKAKIITMGDFNDDPINESIKKILNKLQEFTNRTFKIESDSSRFRPEKSIQYYCDHALITLRTGWMPEIRLEQSLRDTLEYWKEKLTEKNFKNQKKI